MILPDANLLIYAYNSADPNHAKAAGWWEAAVNGTSPVGLPWTVVSAFVRIMTHPRVLVKPMATPDAVALVRLWLDQPNVLILLPGKRFPNLFLGFLESLGTAGNLTTDACLAALAIEHQAELHSCDADFSRFPGLRWKRPF